MLYNNILASEFSKCSAVRQAKWTIVSKIIIKLFNHARQINILTFILSFKSPYAVTPWLNLIKSSCLWFNRIMKKSVYSIPTTTQLDFRSKNRGFLIRLVFMSYWCIRTEENNEMRDLSSILSFSATSHTFNTTWAQILDSIYHFTLNLEIITFWSVHGINTSGLMQTLCMPSLILQETICVHDSMNRPKMKLLLNYFKNVTSGKPCDMYISNNSEDVYKQYNEWRYITSMSFLPLVWVIPNRKR